MVAVYLILVYIGRYPKPSFLSVQGRKDGVTTFEFIFGSLVSIDFL